MWRSGSETEAFSSRTKKFKCLIISSLHASEREREKKRKLLHKNHFFIIFGINEKKENFLVGLKLLSRYLHTKWRFHRAAAASIARM